MEEYRSPFLLPPKCNNPERAKSHALVHANTLPGCPVHRDGSLVDSNWQHWAAYREAFATTGGEENEAQRELFMILMLSQVTESIPPDAPYEHYGIWMTTEPVGQGVAPLVLLGAIAAFIALLITGIALLGI